MWSSLAYFPPSVVGVNIMLGMCPVSIEPSLTCVEAGGGNN